MTRTRKLKRNVLSERYDTIIDGMYAGAETIHVRAPVRYQDGREGVIETEIRVMGLEV
jgi:long-chain acyl-CoA synthetase